MNPALPYRHRITLLIFVSGAVLLALEIAGSRVLAPYFGSSVFVWGSLIGIFLGAISGGYWLGGWLSARWPRQVLLNALLAAAGGFTLLLPLWAGPFCQVIAAPAGGLELGPRFGPLFAALILFALPSMLIGVAPPFAVRLLARDVAGVGAVAGKLYAIGTLGNIVGTLVTAFWLIPLFGIHNILTGIGAVLVATAVFTLPLGRPAVLLLAGGSLLLAVRLAMVPPVILAAPAKGRFEIIEERDSPYTHMRVVRHWLPVRARGEQPVTTFLKFGKDIQGGIFVNPWQQRGREHWSASEYTDMFHLVRLFAPDMQRVLFISGGVGAGGPHRPGGDRPGGVGTGPQALLLRAR
jgi:MFS family permease